MISPTASESVLALDVAKDFFNSLDPEVAEALMFTWLALGSNGSSSSGCRWTERRSVCHVRHLEPAVWQKNTTADKLMQLL